ncbi:MAG TPA: hypothetical protein VGC41_01855 [Kofleriaceae bacterium]
MKIERTEIAGLTTRIVGRDDAKLTLILMHGFGAPGDDLVDFARYLDVPANFVFPAAPLELGGMYGDARAWWLLDLARLERDLRTGSASDRSGELPEGLPAARAQIAALVTEIEKRYPLPIVIGGFSQGSMMAIDQALHRDTPFAGVVLLSSTLIAAQEWLPRMTKLAGTRVFQSHGRADALLPFSVAETLRDHLTTAGAKVEWHAFNGGHEIPPVVLTELVKFLNA